MEFAEVTIKESPGLCRCCLSEGCYKDLGSEYTWMNETEVYADMLLDCFDIGISQHNDGPNGPKRLICEVCITRLRDACNFKKQVVDSEKKFIDMLGRGEFRPMEKQTVLLPIYTSQTPMKAEAIEEVTVSEDYEDTNVEFLDDIDYTEDEEVVKAEAKPPEPVASTSAKRGRPRKADTEPPEKKPKVKPKTTKIPKDVKPEMFTANQLRRRNLQTLFNYTSVMPFKWRGKYLCFFCGVGKENYPDLKMHTKTHIPSSLSDRAMKLTRCQSEIKLDVSEIYCNVCTNTFLNIDDLVTHLMSEHKLSYNRDVSLTLASYRLSDLKCLICGEIFKMFVNLIRHMNYNHPENCYKCDICHQKFNKTRDLSHHVRIQHSKEYNCTKCSQPFSCFSKLLQHKMKDHKSSCNICFQIFPSYHKRLRHMKMDHDVDEGGVCGFCNKTFNTKYTFLDHATKCKFSQLKEEAPAAVIDEQVKSLNLKDLRESITQIINMTTAMPFKFFHSKFRCFYCPKDFTICSELRNHTTIEHPICETTFQSMKLRERSDGVKIKVDTSSLYCKVCFDKFDDFINLVDHLEIEHKTAMKKCYDVFQPYCLVHDKFPCPYCSEVFRYFRLLLNHVSATHSGNEYICAFCGKAFRTYPNLRAHVSRYHSSNRFKCSNCNLGFPTGNGLKLHMGKAHGSKVFNCQQCSETFVSQYQKMRHTLTVHDGGHKCSYCGLAFIKYSYKMNHIRRLHLNEKNVQCTLCNEKFFDTNRLKLHMVRHVGEHLFRCDHCGKKFLRKRNLRGHVALHLKNNGGITQP